MNKFMPHIAPIYPPDNELIFEEWVSSLGNDLAICDRYLIPVHFTSYHVNNNYGNDAQALRELQEFVDGLDRNKKWFSICQYDDSVLIDFKDLDVMRFEMSKSEWEMLPLLCQPHPYKYNTSKRWLLNFVGSKTHPIRDYAQRLHGKNFCYISYERHSIEDYCKVLHESFFTLCFSGYGKNSFRIAEAVQYKSIPVYISSDETFVIPKWMNFEEFGVLIKASEAERIEEILLGISDVEKALKLQAIETAYEKYFTYEANFKFIMKEIETEYNLWKQIGEDVSALK